MNYCVNYSLNNGLYCTKGSSTPDLLGVNYCMNYSLKVLLRVHSHLWFIRRELLCELFTKGCTVLRVHSHLRFIRRELLWELFTKGCTVLRVHSHLLLGQLLRGLKISTRMNSSRMCTTRLLPVSPDMYCSWGRGWGVFLVPGVCLVPGRYLVLGGVHGSGGCTWSPGVYLVPLGGYLVPGGVLSPGEVPGPGGVPGPWGVPGSQGAPSYGMCTWSWGMYLVPHGCTWSLEVYLVLWVYLVLGGAPGYGVRTWSWGVYLVPRGYTWSLGVYLPRYSPSYEQNHRRLWKYNHAPTSLRAVIMGLCSHFLQLRGLESSWNNLHLINIRCKSTVMEH